MTKRNAKPQPFAEAELAATEGMSQAFLDALAAGDFDLATAIASDPARNYGEETAR